MVTSLPTTHYSLRSKRAFALLFAMFVSSIMLSIGLGISNVIYKELVLSGIGRESEISFYTAQTGLECAEYINAVSPTIFPGPGGSSLGPGSDAKCDSKNIGTESPGFSTSLTNAEKGVATFTIRLESDINPDVCADVKVTKDSSNYLTIESRGYNTCDLTNPRRVERSLKMVTYVILPGP